MKLPALIHADRIRKRVQVRFGGLDHNPGAEDGALLDMRDLAGDALPLLAVRSPRGISPASFGIPRGMTAAGGKLALAGDDNFWYDGVFRAPVSPAPKVFAALGPVLVIFPDKLFFHMETEVLGSLEAEWSGEAIAFEHGTLYGEAAECNTIHIHGADLEALFRPGDAVSISGCSRHPENNKTPIIREIQGDRLFFYEFAFVLDGEDGDQPYTETGELSVKRTVPDLDYICQNENRLWGCKGDTIYASKLGDPFNWNVFDGLSTDSYAVDTGSAGPFTGCVSFLGYPIFFKEDHIYKVYGSMPSNFEVLGSATLGVKDGCARTLAIAGECLYYLSNAGIMSYAGGIPQLVSQAFGDWRFRSGAAGSDGLKYYACLENTDGQQAIYVYDTTKGVWFVESGQAADFAALGGDLFFLDQDGFLNAARWHDGLADFYQEDPFLWFALFHDFTDGDPNKKGLSKFQLRLEVDEGAFARVLLQVDGRPWEVVGEVTGDGEKKSHYLPIIPKRGDHYRLRLEGSGGCRLYSLTREAYSGSELKS